jgi:hypothetical protein
MPTHSFDPGSFGVQYFADFALSLPQLKQIREDFIEEVNLYAAPYNQRLSAFLEDRHQCSRPCFVNLR